MNYLAHAGTGWITGIVYADYIAILFFAIPMLPPTPRAATLKKVFNGWLVLTAIWIIVKPWLRTS